MMKVERLRLVYKSFRFGLLSNMCLCSVYIISSIVYVALSS